MVPGGQSGGCPHGMDQEVERARPEPVIGTIFRDLLLLTINPSARPTS